MVNSVVVSYEIAIYDLLGEVFLNIHPVIANAMPPLNEGNFRIDISHLPRGMYFVRIGDRVEKFVKM